MYISMNRHGKYILIVLWTLFSFTSAYRSYCLSDDNHPYFYFGTKTAYQNIRSTPVSKKGCKPIQMWVLSRHGTRHPEEDELPVMKLAIKLHQDIINQYDQTPDDVKLCKKDFSVLKNWAYDDAIEKHVAELTSQGWKDMYELGQSYGSLCPDLVKREYDPQNFYFTHTNTQRTAQSCRAFIDGLFGDDAHNSVTIEPPSLSIHQLLTPYDHCNAWTKEIDENPDFLRRECRKFESSQAFKKIRTDVSERLGFDRILKTKEILSMYEHCRYQKARRLDEISPWCVVFSKDELQLLDYRNDLIRYYFSGHGHEYNGRLGCVPLSHMRNAFENTINNNGESGPFVLAMFSHDTMSNMVITYLGYGKDEQPLKASNYRDLLYNRKTIMSKNVPFAANVVAILYQCSNHGDEQYKVQFFLNERPMEFGECRNGLCDWNYIKHIIPHHCDLSFC